MATNSAVGTINVYVRATNLTDVSGRVNYATNQAVQQEKLVAVVGVKPPEFWQRLAADSQYYTKNLKDENTAREAKELIIPVPNKAGELALENKIRLLESLKEMIEYETGTDCLIAWHNSHPGEDEESNEHFHVIIPERELLPEPQVIVAERDLYYDETGKRVYRKGDIMTAPEQLRPGCKVITKGDIIDHSTGKQATRTMYIDENGTVCRHKSDVYEMGEVKPGCSIVPKGTILHTRYFGSKADELTKKAWLFEAKENIAEWINQELQPDYKRVVATSDSLFIPQQHIPVKWEPENEEEAARKQAMLESNEAIKRYNQYVRDGLIGQKTAEDNKTIVMLAPDRAQQLYYIYTGGTEFVARTKNPDPNADKLRELYKKSTVLSKLYREDSSPEERKELLKMIRANSAEIERTKRALGFYDKKQYENAEKKLREEIKRSQDYYKRLRKIRKQMQKRQQRSEEYSNFIASRIDDLMRSKNKASELELAFMKAMLAINEGIDLDSEEYQGMSVEKAMAKRDAMIAKDKAEEKTWSNELREMDMFTQEDVAAFEVESLEDKMSRIQQSEADVLAELKEKREQLKELRKDRKAYLRTHKETSKPSENRKASLESMLSSASKRSEEHNTGKKGLVKGPGKRIR